MLRRMFAVIAFAFLLDGASAKDVPNVLGEKIDEAVALIEEAGYQAIIAESGKISTFPVGTVGVQIPPGGVQLKPNSSVELYISSGVWIRNFSGATREEVETAMSKSGVAFSFVPAQVNGIAEGVIVGQHPMPESWVDANRDEVKLQVSTGPWIAVPELVGKSMSNANAQANALGLTLNVVSGIPTDGSFPPGPIVGKNGWCAQTDFIAEVINLDPPAGTLVFPDQVIEVVTNRKDGPITEFPCSCEGEFDCVAR